MNSAKQARNTVLLATVGIATSAHAQVPQEPIGATLRYEVAVNGGAWGSNVAIFPGQRVEWRAVVSYTGVNAVAESLGSIFYQPVLGNVDNDGSGTNVDQLGAWRNGGVSGQSSTTLAQGLLTLAEGSNSSELASYGRVHFGFTSRSTNAGSSGALVGHRHSGGSNGSPAGSYIRVAGSNNINWYPSSIPNGSVALNNQILWGVISDNPAPNSTWFVSGTQDVVIFRQAFIASEDEGARVVSISSEAATLFRSGGSSGEDDTRFMRWSGDPVTIPVVRTGVEYIPATIHIIPAPSVTGLVIVFALSARVRRRNS